MHSKPVTAVYEWIAPDESWCKWLIVVGLVAKIQLRHTPLRDNAAVICLFSTLVQCCLFMILSLFAVASRS